MNKLNNLDYDELMEVASRYQMALEAVRVTAASGSPEYGIAVNALAHGLVCRKGEECPK